MKMLVYIAAAILAASLLPAQPESNISDLASLSVKQAEDLVNNTEGVKIKRDLVAAAVTSRRMDLIKLCFKNHHTRGLFLEEVIQIKDENFKDQIVLMMLRTKSAFWPNDDPYYAGGIYSGIYLGEPFISSIKKHLPDIPLSKDLVSTHMKRTKLAEELAAVIEKRGKVVSTPPAERPMKPRTPPADSQTNHKDAQSMKSPSSEVKDNGVITQKIVSDEIITFVGIIGVIIAGILIWRLKSKPTI